MYNLTLKPNEFIQTEILICKEDSKDFQKAQAMQTYKHVHTNVCSPVKSTGIIHTFNAKHIWPKSLAVLH